MADIFSLALPDGLEYRDVLAEAHRQMAQVATQAAEDLLRNRVAENGDADEDWLSSDLDSLTDALNEAVCGADRVRTGRSRAPVSAEPSDADASPWQPPAATEPAAVRPLAAANPRFPGEDATGGGQVAPNLLDRLTGIVAVCRPVRRPVSLLLVKLSAGEELLTACGPREIATIRQVLGKVCTKPDHPGSDLPAPYGIRLCRSFCPGRNGSKRSSWATI